MTVGEKIRLARRSRGLTQKEVADKCGMADSAIRKYESGKVIPKVKTLLRIAEALDCDPTFLLEDELSEAYFNGTNRTYEEIRRYKEEQNEVSKTVFVPGETYLDGHLSVENVKQEDDGNISVTFSIDGQGLSAKEIMEILESVKHAAESVGISPMHIIGLVEQMAKVSKELLNGHYDTPQLHLSPPESSDNTHSKEIDEKPPVDP